MAEINLDHRALLEPQLHDTEDLLWTEAPDPNAVDPSHLQPLGVGVLCVIFWAALLREVTGDGQTNIMGWLPLLILAVLLIGPLVLIAFAIRGLRSPKHQVYAITSQRLLIFDQRGRGKCMAADLSAVRGVVRRKDSKPSIRFKGLNRWQEHAPPFNRFVGLSDPDHVAALVEGLIAKKETP